MKFGNFISVIKLTVKNLTIFGSEGLTLNLLYRANVRVLKTMISTVLFTKPF